MTKKPFIAVIGGRKASVSLLRIAEEVGKGIAGRGAVLVCGGLGGVMEYASKGAKSEGGTTVGILPYDKRGGENEFIDIPIPTGLGIARNVIICRTADAVIAIGGQYGTLSEIAFALQMGKPVVGVQTWEVKGIHQAVDAADAVSRIFEFLESKEESPLSSEG